MALAAEKLAVQLQSASLSFSGTTVLSKINLDVMEGASVVLVGPSGQGKSALLKMMAGLFPLTEGQLFLQGLSFWSLPTIQKNTIRRDVGFLFQKNALFDSMTCAENLSFPLQYVKGWSLDQCKDTVDKALHDVGLSHATDLFPDAISGGMQKRLGIARALVLQSKIVFYDDPTAGLDPITSRKIIDLILKLRREQRTTLISVVNDPMRARQLTQNEQDQIYFVDQAQVKSCGFGKELHGPAVDFFNGISA